MITCIAIDDEPLALKQMIGYIGKITNLDLVESFTSAIKAMEFLQDNPVDLMFVDIHMPDLSGMDFVKSLASSPKVIFTTAYREYAVEGFQVDAADYLVKPISFPAFLKAVNKTIQRYFADSDSSTTIQRKEQFLFIKTEPVMALLNLKNIIEHLPRDKFMRVHRSYIVNLDKVNTIERNRIIFDKKIYIPVSDQYKDDFQDFMNNYFLK